MVHAKLYDNWNILNPINWYWTLLGLKILNFFNLMYIYLYFPSSSNKGIYIIIQIQHQSFNLNIKIAFHCTCDHQMEEKGPLWELKSRSFWNYIRVYKYELPTSFVRQWKWEKNKFFAHLPLAEESKKAIVQPYSNFTNFPQPYKGPRKRENIKNCSFFFSNCMEPP